MAAKWKGVHDRMHWLSFYVLVYIVRLAIDVWSADERGWGNMICDLLFWNVNSFIINFDLQNTHIHTYT